MIQGCRIFGWHSRPVVVALLWIGLVVLACAHVAVAGPRSYEVVVHSAITEKTIEMLKERNFWGHEQRGEQLTAPRIVVAVASKKWPERAKAMPVETKKELFYRAIVPMVLIANEKIAAERKVLLTLQEKTAEKQVLREPEQAFLSYMKERYRVGNTDIDTEIRELLNRVDEIPPSLALGQSAYESGYGTSRFAQQGNALFGQWTMGGGGMKPEEHRESKGDYGVASFMWPFDSVESYMVNLNSHNAYQELREKRAELRKAGKEIRGLDLVPALGSYSEKGEEYIATLKNIIQHNNLSVADDLSLRDEPFSLVVGTESAEMVAEIEEKLDKARKSGELDRIVEGMGLQFEGL